MNDCKDALQEKASPLKSQQVSMAELKDKYDILAILIGLIIDTENKLYRPKKCLS